MKKLFSRLGCVVFVCSAVAAQAQPTVNEIDAARLNAERIQREQQDQLEYERRQEQQKQPRTRIEITPPVPLAPRSNGVCKDVKNIVVDGAQRLSAAQLLLTMKPFESKCLTVSDIENLLGELTKQYIELGFIAVRVYVQAQDIASGVLRILVVEGTVEKLMLEDAAGNSHLRLSFAFPDLEGHPLNLRDIEQGLDQLNRLPSNNATMEIKPGNQAGGSIVVIRNQPKRRISANMGFDNHGSSSVGEEQLALSSSLDSPLHLNDSLSVSHRRTTAGNIGVKHSRSNSLTYTVPYGYFTFNATHSESDYATPINVPGSTLVAHGTSSSTSAAVEYTAHRDQFNRVTLSSTLAVKTSDNFLDQTFLAISSRTLSTLDLGAVLYTRLANGLLTLNVNHVRGLTILNALRDAPDLPVNLPHAQYAKWTASVSWVKPFQLNAQPFSFSSTVNAQQGINALYGSEQFFVGGLYSVRGFRNTSIAGDSGYYWRNELSMPIRLDNWPVTVKPFVGFDMGHIRDRFGVAGGDLSGVALGVSVSSPRVNTEISFAKPLKMPARLTDEGLQLFAKLNVPF